MTTTHATTHTTRDLIALLGLAAVWGGSFLFLRIASPAIGPLGVAGWRVAGGALMLMPLVLLRRQGAGLRRHLPWLAGSAVLSCLIPFIGFSLAARQLPAGLLSILNATTPMWGALVGWLWAQERLSPLRAAGLAVGFAGVALLAADGHQFSARGSVAAAALALGSTISYAFAVHYNKRYLAALSPLANSAGTLAIAAVLLCGPAWWMGPQPSLPYAALHPAMAKWADVPILVWSAMVGLACLCTGVAYLIFYQLIERVGPSRALTVTFLIPVFGMLWGALFLGERVTLPMVGGTLVILAGTWLSNRASNRAWTPASPSHAAPRPHGAACDDTAPAARKITA